MRGLLLSILKNSERHLEKKNSHQVNADTRFGSLFSPIVNSTVILCIILFIGIFTPVLKQIPFLLEYKGHLRAMSYCLLCCLTFWQIWTVFITLIPADMLKHQSEVDIARQNNVDHLMRRR